MDHLVRVPQVLDEDEQEIKRKEGTYQGSWKQRGGVGAFMMLARKWDRIEGLMRQGYNYDLFKALNDQRFLSGSDGTLIAEIRDLRRYLALVEAEALARGWCVPSVVDTDQGQDCGEYYTYDSGSEQLRIRKLLQCSLPRGHKGDHVFDKPVMKMTSDIPVPLSSSMDPHDRSHVSDGEE